MWNTVRIFISSTFKDMDVERDALKNIVLPQLNHYFAPMRYQIEMVDLRHSIETDKEESAEQREKIIFNICMDEIESCKPFFLGLVGHRYGWIPDKQQMSTKENAVVANAAFFPLNSQAALQFYQYDPTVQSTYKRLYHIGWPLESAYLSKDSKEKNITGGETQQNDCHFVELMCACAAFDFFTLPDAQLEGTKAQYLFRILDCSDGKCFNINAGSDLVGSEAGEIFTNKLAAFLSFAHLDLKAGTKAFLNTLKEHDIKEYDIISPEDQKNIEDYMKYFDYRFEDGIITYGWICQIKNSLGSGAFILNSKAFPNLGKKGSPDFEDDIDKLINDPKHHWDLSKGKGLLGGKDALNTLVFHMKSSACLPKEEQSVNSVKERFFAHIYNAITVAQNFNVKSV